jgi:hypothetical protein
MTALVRTGTFLGSSLPALSCPLNFESKQVKHRCLKPFKFLCFSLSGHTPLLRYFLCVGSNANRGCLMSLLVLNYMYVRIGNYCGLKCLCFSRKPYSGSSKSALGSRRPTLCRAEEARRTPTGVSFVHNRQVTHRMNLVTCENL